RFFKLRVKETHACTETLTQSILKLWSESDLWNQQKNLASSLKYGLSEMQIDFGLSASGFSMDQMCQKPFKRIDRLDNGLLSFGELGKFWREFFWSECF